MKAPNWLFPAAITGALLALLLVFAAGTNDAKAVPANDNFANAVAVATPNTGDIVALANTGGAGTEAGEAQPCGLIGATVWYTWTSPAFFGTAVFDTYGSDFNTVMAVYTGASLNTLALQTCNDNFGATRSGVAVNHAPSTTYYIQVGGAGGAAGNVVLNHAAGASMLVDSIGNLSAADGTLNLAEAMLLARGGTGPTGLNRALTAGETAATLNIGDAGFFGQDIIHFSPAVFPPNAPATIGLAGPLPGMQPGYPDNISGIGAGVIVDGLNGGFTCFSLEGADYTIIEGLEIRRCSNGISISNTGDHNRIGGWVLAAQGNTIRENETAVNIIGGSSNVVAGNRLGTDRSGLLDFGNNIGVLVMSGTANQVGGPSVLERNIISGNLNGIITQPFSSNTIVKGNYVGVGADGLLAIPNSDSGISLSGTAEQLDDNVISGNGTGVSMSSAGAYLRGNRVGTDATGEIAVGNNIGIHVNGSENSFIGQGVLGNLISGNASHGVMMNSDAWGNFVSGNRIGVDASGTEALANGGAGVFIAGDASSNAIGGNFSSSRNIISGNQGDGVRIEGGAGATGVTTSLGATAPIPNPGWVDSDINILRHGVVTDVDVTLTSITHPRDFEINILLYAPNGDVIVLSDANGGDGDNYSYTKFDDEAPTAITAATAPFTGTYRPEQPLADLDGIDPYGTWTLKVQDGLSNANAGTLGAWTLHLKTQGNSVQGNYIGPDVNGTTNYGNWGDGVYVSGIGNLIGDPAPLAQQVISGNSGNGVEMVGMAANARTYASNAFLAIPDFTTVNSTIQVPSEALVTDVNVQVHISHGTAADLDITLIGPLGTPVELSTDNGGSGDNYSATVFDDEAATAITAGAAPFTGSFRPEGKLRSLDGKDAGGTWTLQVADDGLLPSGTLQGWSITITVAGNRVQGNYIGVDVSGGAYMSNQNRGIILGDLASGNLIGGDTAGARNVISANGADGILVGPSSAESNTIQGNLIGVSASGSAALGNVGDGIEVQSAGNLIGGAMAGARNVISANGGNGVLMQNTGASANVVQGNYVGTNSSGNADLGNALVGVAVSDGMSNLIGGAQPEMRNLVSGNVWGVVICCALGTGNTVQGNFIGTDAAGTGTVSNNNAGIRVAFSSGNTIGGSAPGAGNVVGQSSVAVELDDSPGNTVQGNFIGTDLSGTVDLGSNVGIHLEGASSIQTLGGTAPGAGNTIAFNTVGILVPSQNRVAIRGNRMYNNALLGIDLGNNGVEANDAAPDADGSPPNIQLGNNLQNYPTLTGSTVDTVLDITTVDGTIESAFSTFYVLDFYYGYECDATGNGEGRFYLGTGGVATNASGVGSFSMQYDVEIPAGTFITATATDPNGNTSEFSNCIAAFNDSDDDNDGFTDDAEAGMPLCANAVDDDSDGTANDGCPGGPPLIGLFSEAQFNIGTGPMDPCGNSGWPADVWDQPPFSANKVTVQDLTAFIAPVRRLGTSPGTGNFSPRWDLVPGKGIFSASINVQDMTALVALTPPMLNGARALNGPSCPFPP